MRFVLKMVKESSVSKLYVANLGKFQKFLWADSVVLTITDSAGMGKPEVHDVLREGPSLIRENEIDLTQLIVEVAALDRCWFTRGLDLTMLILVNDDSLKEANQLQGNQQADWHEASKDNEPGAPTEQHIEDKALSRSSIDKIFVLDVKHCEE